MDSELWRRIEKIYNSALDLEHEQREEFLKNACVGNESIYKEVQRLLKLNEEAEDFIESPALEVIAGNIADASQHSLQGKELGNYLITRLIGKGGMGEVYLAKDRKLGRDVAIKVLPEGFDRDADRVARFKREAKLLAALNHTNIATIHGLEESDGIHFLVLELVEGETLAERLKRGPIPVEESLELALQIAEALGAAHENMVVHRDLKPANIKITPEGKVKVLDFGLAKAISEEAPDDLSNSPTLSDMATRQGMILGTAAYMSPEQARGKAVDKRTDIWAFGCVLFEMLTGKTVFSGEDVSDILAAVIRAEPDWDKLPRTLNWRLREVIERCLKKDPRNRYHDISDVRLDIQNILANPNSVVSDSNKITEPKTKLKTTLPWIAAIILTAVIIGIAVWPLKPTSLPEPRQVIRLEYSLPEDQHLDDSGNQSISISPDGSKFVYATETGLYLRYLSTTDAELIRGTGGKPQRPFFSPDGKKIGYWSDTNNQLEVIDTIGGIPQHITKDESLGSFSWATDDKINYGRYSESSNGIIAQVSVADGTLEEIVKVETSTIAAPYVLPSGGAVLFSKLTNIGSTIWVYSIKDKEMNYLVDGIAARYLPTGHIVYVKDSNLYATGFDLDKLEIVGGERRLVENIIGNYEPYYAVSASGTLIYLSGLTKRTLVWVDRAGNIVPVSDRLIPYNYRYPSLSPDGLKIALTVRNTENSKIHVWDILREELSSLSPDYAERPIWSPDGEQIVFRSKNGISLINQSGQGSIKNLFPDPDGKAIFPWAWTEDNEITLLEYNPPGNFDIAVLNLQDEPKWEPLFQNKDYIETQPKVSPSGIWMAYTTNSSDQNEVYICPFPDVDKKSCKYVSTGHSPLWSLDGKELFYRKGDAVMTVPVQTEPELKLEKTDTLFEGSFVSPTFEAGDLDTDTWDIGPDERFLMIKESPVSKINIVVNWFEELKQKVPVE